MNIDTTLALVSKDKPSKDELEDSTGYINDTLLTGAEELPEWKASL